MATFRTIIKLSKILWSEQSALLETCASTKILPTPALPLHVWARARVHIHILGGAHGQPTNASPMSAQADTCPWVYVPTRSEPASVRTHKIFHFRSHQLRYQNFARHQRLLYFNTPVISEFVTCSFYLAMLLIGTSACDWMMLETEDQLWIFPQIKL